MTFANLPGFAISDTSTFPISIAPTPRNAKDARRAASRTVKRGYTKKTAGRTGSNM